MKTRTPKVVPLNPKPVKPSALRPVKRKALSPISPKPEALSTKP